MRRAPYLSSHLRRLGGSPGSLPRLFSLPEPRAPSPSTGVPRGVSARVTSVAWCTRGVHRVGIQGGIYQVYIGWVYTGWDTSIYTPGRYIYRVDTFHIHQVGIYTGCTPPYRTRVYRVYTSLPYRVYHREEGFPLREVLFLLDGE